MGSTRSARFLRQLNSGLSLRGLRVSSLRLQKYRDGGMGLPPSDSQRSNARHDTRKQKEKASGDSLYKENESNEEYSCQFEDWAQ